MKKSIIVSFIISLIFCISCGKKNNITTSIIAKWTLVKSVSTDTITQHQYTETFSTGSYVSFSNNGTCYSFVDSVNNISTWHYLDNNAGVYIQDNNSFVATDSGYTIQNLTPQSLILLARKVELGQSQTLYLQK